MQRKEIGLAVIGCGVVGRIRATLARQYPGIGWLGLCDVKEDLGRQLANEIGADYFTTRIDPEKETRRLVAKLQALGHTVTLEPAA